MNKKYKLLIIDRYCISASNCYILPEGFFKKFKKKVLKGAKKVEGGFMGCDTEEETYLWQATDEKVNNKSKLFMDDVYDMWEEEEWD